MIVRLAGALLLIGGSVGLSACYARFESRRVGQSEGFLLLLRHVRAQIACFHMPLARVWETFSCPELERCGFLPALRETGDFAAALERCRRGVWASADEMTLLRAFGSEIGRSYLEEQISCCDYYIGEFESAYARHRTERPARARLFRCLCVTGGLMLVILLL